MSKLDDLEREFGNDQKEEITSIQNQTLGVSGRPTKEQRRMQVMYDPEEDVVPHESEFVSGYMKLIRDTDANTQALFDSIIPMDANVMAHRSLSVGATDNNNERLHMISNQFGLSARSLKTEKKAKKHRKIDMQVNW